MRVLYFTPCSFRTVNAGALRNVTLARAIWEAGYEIEVIHPGFGSDDDWFDSQGDSFAIRPANPVPARKWFVARLRRFVFGPVSRNSISGLRDADLVVAYNPGPFAWWRLRLACSRARVPLLVDVTEWLSAEDFPPRVRWFYAFLYARHMRKLPADVDGSFVVSNALAAIFGGQDRPCLVIPPLHEYAAMAERRSGSSIRVLVSGSALTPGGKDGSSLSMMLAAMQSSPILASRFQLHVAGTTPSWQSLGVPDEFVRDRVFIHGQLDYVDAQRLLRSMDALVVLRDPEIPRLNFGFPSKVTEAVANGVHVIANNFSDIDKVLIEGAEWTSLDAFDVPSLIDALERFLLHLEDDGRFVGSDRRRFSPTRFAPQLGSFLKVFSVDSHA